MTVLSDYISRMIDGGMQPEEAMQVAAELFAAGVASASARPSAGALRTRKWRHKASQSVTERHSIETSQTVTERHKPSHCDASTVLPIEDKIKNSKRRNSDRASRGTRIAPDWSPSPDEKQFAVEEGLSAREIEREAARFRDYWKGRAGSGGVKLDWTATWQNWIRTTAEKLGKTPSRSGPAGADTMFLAAFGSEELEAWDDYTIREKGKALPRNRDGGWRVPARWPPGYKPRGLAETQSSTVAFVPKLQRM